MITWILNLRPEWWEAVLATAMIWTFWLAGPFAAEALAEGTVKLVKAARTIGRKKATDEPK